MIKIAICDDSIDELSSMTSFLEEYRSVSPMEYKYTVFHNGFELMTVLENGATFEIYCLDIIMPGFSGIDLGKEIRLVDKNAQILFFTSAPDFALDSYSVKATNYILKPVTKEKLFVCLDDALGRITEDAKASIVVKSNDGLQKIPLSKLVFAEAMGRKTLFHLASDQVVECILQFSVTCENLLKHDQFMNPHRSYLVNMSYIDAIEKDTISLQTLASIPIAQGKSKKIKEIYLAFQMVEV